ncbi:hypothetical protein EG68_00962, partial [Paragonimus skrjabini miyazakii]
YINTNKRRYTLTDQRLTGNGFNTQKLKVRFHYIKICTKNDQQTNRSQRSPFHRFVRNRVHQGLLAIYGTDPKADFMINTVSDIYINGTVYHHKEPMQWDRSLSSKSSHLFLLLEENLCLTNKVALTRNATLYRTWHSCVLQEAVQGSVLALTRVRFEQTSMTLRPKEVRKLIWDLLTEFAQRFGSKNVHYYGGIVSVEGTASNRALSAGMIFWFGLLTSCQFLYGNGV